MFRRWIIRGLLITLLTLCVGTWHLSHFRVHFVSFQYTGLIGAGTSDGKLIFGWCRENNYYDEGIYFHPWNVFEDPFDDRPTGTEYRQSFFGFLMNSDYWFGSYTKIEAGVPFWFLTGVLGLIFIYAWRKTRHKPEPARAFPVEMDRVKA